MTVWEYLNTLTSLRRAQIVANKVFKLVGKYHSDPSMTAIEIQEAVEDGLSEWFKSSAKQYFRFN